MSSSLSTNMESILDRFDDAWNGPTPPRIEVYLAEADPDRRFTLLIELVRIDLERRLAAGEKVRLEEDYLSRFPELSAEPPAIVTLLKHEFAVRRRNEPELMPAEYVARFPQCQTELIAQLPTLDEIPNGASQLKTAEAPPGLDLRGYELIETLGKGGMGEVYRCVDPALGRDLAIKVMKSEYGGRAEAARRFLREARVTGSLQHPGIVPIHNLGRLRDGRLHYTMRLVRGQTFADILKEEAGKEERLPYLLTIFEKICQAVAYAHSKRVIHRDLKPQNIMVGKFGEVQVMDWGLAKALTLDDSGDEPDEATDIVGTRIFTESADTPVGLTRTGAGFGTLQYMPSEQARGKWKAVDERADVFALGSILCEILTGKPAYVGSSSTELCDQVERGDTAEALQRLQYCGVGEALTELCRACLNLKRKDRPSDAGVVARRVAEYQTQVQERLRQAEVERAEAQAKAREERKRRRWVIAFVMVLLAGIIGTSVGLVRAERLRVLALEKEGEAQNEKAVAQAAQKQAMEALRATTDDVVEQLIGGKPFLGPAEKAFLEATLKRWQAFADAAGAGEPAQAIRAEGVFRVAKLQAKLGQREKAVFGYREAITLRRKLVDDYLGIPQHRSDLALAYAHLGKVFADLGKKQDGEGALRQALAMREKLAAKYRDEPEYRFDEAVSHADLGWSLHNQGKYAEAEPYYNRALVLYDQLRAASPAVAKYRRSMAETYRMLGILLRDQRKFTATGAAFSKSVTLLQKLVDEFPDVPDYGDRLAHSHTDLGVAFSRQGKHSEAEASYRAALAAMKTLAADFPAVPDYRSELALIYNNLGVTMRCQDKQDAEMVLRQGLAVAEKLVDEFPDVPQYRHALGMVQCSLGEAMLYLSKEPEKALPWCDKAIATEGEARRRGGSIDRVHFGLMAAYGCRAETLCALQRHAEALKDYDKAVELATESLRPFECAARAVVRVRAGQVATAIEEAEELAKNGEGEVLFNTARVYALAIKPTKANPISPQQQEKYAERAIALLHQALAKGYKDADHLKNNDDWKTLRQRDDFQNLLREIHK